jgi:hypothetical protein
MRRMFSSRSSLLKPNPFVNFCRTTSPSSNSTLSRERCNRSNTSCEIVVLPEHGKPVNQSVTPPKSLFGLFDVILGNHLI